MAAHGWSKRVIRSNPRVDIDWEMIRRDQTAQDCFEETQAHGLPTWQSVNPLLISPIYSVLV